MLGFAMALLGRAFCMLMKFEGLQFHWGGSTLALWLCSVWPA